MQLSVLVIVKPNGTEMYLTKSLCEKGYFRVRMSPGVHHLRFIVLRYFLFIRIQHNRTFLQQLGSIQTLQFISNSFACTWELVTVSLIKSVTSNYYLRILINVKRLPFVKIKLFVSLFVRPEILQHFCTSKSH